MLSRFSFELNTAKTDMRYNVSARKLTKYCTFNVRQFMNEEFPAYRVQELN